MSKYADFKPIAADDAEMAFGPANFKQFAPMYQGYHKNDCPPEFKQHNGTMWNAVVSQWFFAGLKKDDEFTPKDGIDVKQALRHIGVVLGSWEPDHQSKEAIAAYLMSLWFDDYTPSAEHLPRFREAIGHFKRIAA